MPKKLKKAAAGKKRAGSSSQQVDHSLMFASDFTDFKIEAIRSSNSPASNSDDDGGSDIEDELLAHYYFSSSGSTQLPDRLDTFLQKSFNITTAHEAQDGCHGDTRKHPTTPAGSKRPSDGKGGVAKRPKRHRSSAEEGEIILLSSSSEEGGASEGSSEDMVLEYSSDQQWSINQKDMMGRNAYEKRYGAIKQRGLGRHSKCFNCKQKGHTTSMCPHPKRNQVCYLCGVVGHVSMRCPDSRCQYCFQPNHRGRQCNPSYSFGTCGRCYIRGHVDCNCPDGWRQFHNTTSNDRRELDKFTAHEMKRCCVPYCANCAQRGHFVHECPRARPRGVPYPFLPYIARYNESQFPRPRPHHSESQSSNHSSKQHRRASLPDYPSRSTDKRRREEEDRYQEPSRKNTKRRRHSSKHEDHFPRRTHTDPLPNPAHHSTPHPSPHRHDDGLLSTPPLRSLSFEHSRTPHMPPPLPPPPPPFSPMPPPPPAHFHHVNQEEHFPRTPFTHQHYSQPSSAHIPRPPPQHRLPARRHSEGWTPHTGGAASRVRININGYWDNDRGFVKERSRR